MTIPLASGLRLPSGPAPGGQSWQLCRTMRRLSIGTYNWLTDGRSDLVPNEVAITDYNLLTLRLRHPREVVITRFTNREEPLNGADWEWWFGRPGRWVGVRVEAKKLDSRGRRYVDLRKAVGDPARDQVGLLIEAASRAGLPACYVFYNGEPEDAVVWRQSPCLGSHNWEWGCAVAGAGAVKRVTETPSDLVADLGPLSLPWSHFVCCARTEGLPKHVEQVLVELGEETSPNRDVLPPYARHLIDDGQPVRHPPELAGVMVVRDDAV